MKLQIQYMSADAALFTVQDRFTVFIGAHGATGQGWIMDLELNTNIKLTEGNAGFAFLLLNKGSFSYLGAYIIGKVAEQRMAALP